jgi:gamma-glutamyltranspeptidase/glutathione hydrolase
VFAEFVSNKKPMLRLSVESPNQFGPSRAAVMGTRGMVATSQPLAALAGVEILRQGGNAVDAAVCAAAMLNVIEPMSTGIGGDLFAIVYLASEGKVLGLNASGRSAYAATLDEYRARLSDTGAAAIEMYGPLAVTVPGTVDGWSAILERCGRMRLAQVLGPAIRAAEQGFAVAPHAAFHWQEGEKLLAARPDSARTWLTKSGRAPRAGELFRNQPLANTLRLIAEHGRDAFYVGPIADQIVRFFEAGGGLFTYSDFADCNSDWVTPLSAGYRDYEILELPPNGQGIVTLEALSILGGYDLAGMGYHNPDAIHLQVEAAKLALHDARKFVTDPAFVEVQPESLLSEAYIGGQRSRIAMGAADANPQPAGPANGDTVYVCAVDSEGNVASLINSIFVPWGSGITVGDTGILMQNRGFGFSLDPAHVNVIAPHKRTRHTIIPGMVMRSGKPLAAFGCVGGDMQPQGQVQFLCNMIDFGMNVQDAIDAPRWRYEGTGADLALEAGFSPEIINELVSRGHQITGRNSGFFGGAQAIVIHPEYGTLQGGSDSRRDGCAIGF